MEEEVKYYNINEASEFLGMTRQSLNYHMKLGRLYPVTTKGSEKLFTETQLLKFKEELQNKVIQQRIVAVANHKGGVGKTTITANLAIFLGANGYKVLVLDNDPQANLSRYMLKNSSPLDRMSLVYKEKKIQSYYISNSTYQGVDIIPSNIDLAETELIISAMMMREQSLKSALMQSKDIVGGYDFILIDNPPTLGNFTVNAVVASTDYLLVVEASSAAETSPNGMLALVKVANPYTKNIGIVISKYDSTTNDSKNAVMHLKEAFGTQIFDTIIPRATNLAIRNDKDSALVENDEKFLLIYNQLGNEFIKRITKL